MENEITIEQVSYKNVEQTRILKACLETWFKNPKDLNLTAPKMTYPFNFNRWIADSYSKENTLTFVLKKDVWIIGYMSLQLQPNNDFVHLFHVFIDRIHRGKGYSKKLIDGAISFAKKNGIPAITLYVIPANDIAVNLYKSYGFIDTGQKSKSGSPRMRLEIT